MCTNLTSISFKRFKSAHLFKDENRVLHITFFPSDVVPEHTHEGMITTIDAALPFLESLCIKLCSITGKWLSLILRHSPTLKELDLCCCPQLKEKIQSKLLPASEASLSRYLDGAFQSSVRTSSGYVGIVLGQPNYKNVSG